MTGTDVVVCREIMETLERPSLRIGTLSEPAPLLAPHLEGVSVVVPVYNEEKGAGDATAELLQVLSEKIASEIPYEVILVDDGSSDGTAEAIAPNLSERVTLVRHTKNRGYGAAIKTGMNRAKYPWILITDADGTYPAEHIPDLLRERSENQMVVGARIGANSHVPLLRRPPKWVLRKLAAYLSRQDIPDLNSGLRVFRRDIADGFRNILPNQFSYTTTITLAMFAAGWQVKYVPINYLKREGKSKIRPIADTLGFLKLIFRTVMYFDPLRVFMPTAFLFMIGAMGVGVGSYLLSGRVMDVTTVLLFVTGFQMLALGMIADAVNRRLR